jgi:hypothetical protein
VAGEKERKLQRIIQEKEAVIQVLEEKKSILLDITTTKGGVHDMKNAYK